MPDPHQRTTQYASLRPCRGSSRTPQCFALLWILALGLSFAASVASARKVKITLLHTTDLHGHILPTADYDGNNDIGGLLRLATLVERERARNPNTMLVDCGDFIQGSPHTWLTKGKITVTAMDQMGYDGIVLGNHELDWGLPFTKKLIEDFDAPILAANAVVSSGTHPLPGLQPFIVREFEGVKVAVVGLTTPGMPLWFRPDTLGNLEFESATDALKRTLPMVRENHPDILILATHMGYRPFQTERQAKINQVKEVLRDFPEFDIICGGHTHRVVEQQLVRSTLYTQAGYFGIRLGRVEIEFDTDQGTRGEIISLTPRMLKTDASVPQHAELKTKLKPDLDRTAAYLNAELGATTIDIHPKADAAGRSPAQRILAGAIAAAADADFVLHGTLNRDFTLPIGIIREHQLWKFVPYENRIGVALLTPPELREILEESAAYGSSHSMMGLWGGSYEINESAPAGKRIVNLRFADGGKPHGKKRYRVAFNSHTLASSGGRYPVLRASVDRPIVRLEMLDIQTRDAVREWFARVRVVDAEDLP